MSKTETQEKLRSRLMVTITRSLIRVGAFNPNTPDKFAANVVNMANAIIKAAAKPAKED